MAKRKRRLPRWIFPLLLEKKYQELIETYNDELIDEVNNVILTIIALQSTKEIATELKRLAVLLDKVDKPTEKAIGRIFDGVVKHNAGQFNKLIKSYYGEGVIRKAINVSDLRALFIKQNVSLIVTLPQKLHSTIEQVIYSSKQRGLSIESITQILQDKFKTSQFNAKRIARDQIGKLNAQLSKDRQTNLGITHYIWRGVLDGRERASHLALEGKKIAWDHPPASTNHCHVGEEIMCRCWAEPIFEELTNGTKM